MHEGNGHTTQTRTGMGAAESTSDRGLVMCVWPNPETERRTNQNTEPKYTYGVDLSMFVWLEELVGSEIWCDEHWRMSEPIRSATNIDRSELKYEPKQNTNSKDIMWEIQIHIQIQLEFE